MKWMRIQAMRRMAAAAVLAVVLGTTLSASAQNTRYEARPGSTLKIDGTSTVHDWTVEGKIIGGFIEFDSNMPLDTSKGSAELKVTPKVDVKIPVSSLKSGKSSMDNIMHETLKMEGNPSITYILKEMTAKERKAGEPLMFDAKGELTVAGVKQDIEMPVTLVPEGNKLRATGTKELKMTDFGMKPPAPALGLGLIKTGDAVKVTFEWVTAKKEPKTAAN